MPQLLLELFSEEIPARMQAGAARDLERMAAERLKAQELSWSSLRSFAGPRRLTLVVDGLPAATPDRHEEIKGPKATAPPQALEGFLRKAGVAREELTERDGVLFATLARPGRPTPAIAAQIVGEIVRGFPWPKSMRSGASSFRWVRPLKRVLFLFDRAVVPFEIDGIVAGDLTEGHRFLGPSPGSPFAVRDFADYEARLRDAYVILDAAERRTRIAQGAAAVCAAEGLELAPDEGLLDEVAGLAEWPTPVLGDIDPAFMDLPGEVIRTSMRTHQKYFAVRKPDALGLSPRFVVVANVEAPDGGAQIARGNAKVLAARLSDARFFWDEDQKPDAFAKWAEKLKGVTFHARLGTMAERVDRIAALAEQIAPAVKADPKLAGIAARLAKLDLASAMVGEFPELQGRMGGDYVRMAGVRGQAGVATHKAGELLRGAEPDGQEDPLSTVDLIYDGKGTEWWSGRSRDDIEAISDAVRDHYKPVGPSDSVPLQPVTVAVALADKLDTLVGFFAIDEKPTGSKDPFALRRAALGVIRLVLENESKLPLRPMLEDALVGLLSRDRAGLDIRETIYHLGSYRDGDPTGTPLLAFLEGSPDRLAFVGHLLTAFRAFVRSSRPGQDYDDLTSDLIEDIASRGRWLERASPSEIKELVRPVLLDLLAFFADRLKVQLREEGKRHDLVDAVFALGDDDLVRIVARVEALSGFLATDDGANLLAGIKRAVNILRAEAKKNPGEAVEGAVDPSRLAAPEEQALAAALEAVQAELEPKLQAEDFAGAMTALARLRTPVDAFFDKVLVNDPDPAVRLNRLRLLAAIRDAANRVADFSLIAG